MVASDIAGNRELIENGNNGLLFLNRDPKAFANAVLAYLKRPDWAKEIAQRGRQTVTTRFSLERMTRNYEKLYEQTLFQKTRRKSKES
jgi:glycosyltransferase involved in cell wall biosynthesis